MYVLVDHRDSFTYNLVQLFGAIGVEVRVLPAPGALDPAVLPEGTRAVVLSPGPGDPRAQQGSWAWARSLLGRVPLLGVCLGHQILCGSLGASLELAREPVHGRARDLFHHGRGPFVGLPSPLKVARYHSWVVAERGLPEALSVIARDAEGQVMAVGHREHLAYGLQFHPESFLTPQGRQLAEGFVREVAAHG